MDTKERDPCYAGRLLDAWLADRGKTHDELVDLINQQRRSVGLVGDIQRSNVWRWRMGRQKPDLNHARILADITAEAVPMSAWADGAEAAAAAA